MEVTVQLQSTAALLPKKYPRYSFGRRLGGPQSRSGRDDDEENHIIAPTENWMHSSRP